VAAAETILLLHLTMTFMMLCSPLANKTKIKKNVGIMAQKSHVFLITGNCLKIIFCTASYSQLNKLPVMFTCCKNVASNERGIYYSNSFY